MDNPLANDPSYIKILATRINRQPTIDLKPNTGGKQFSIRIDALTTQYIKGICDKSKWSKSDVISALIQRGLFDLFNRLDENKLQEIKDNYGFLPNHQDAS